MDRTLAILATLAALSVATMVIGILTTRGSQDYFQTARSVSQVKFHASYLAALLFSFGFLQFGRLGRTIAVVLWCYIPFGILISVTPVEQAKALVLARTIFFVFAFILSAVLFASQAKSDGRYSQ
ncbi:hypothetical protein XH92_16830 [Bradyrhizobium sp. CCBAU 53421]|nr:hypothetical protein XH92_16830 [Bradyrhizobium sp. CCBAU 53421]